MLKLKILELLKLYFGEIIMNKAIYPGSFDPITFGHIDIILRASKIFDYIVIGIAKDNSKTNFLFTETERKFFIENSLSEIENIEVKIFDGLLTDFVKKENSNIIIRGLRVLSDFEYEFRMALMNRKLDDEDDKKCWKISSLYQKSDLAFDLLSNQTIEWELFLLENNTINVELVYKIDYVKEFEMNSELIKNMSIEHNNSLKNIASIVADNLFEIMT